MTIMDVLEADHFEVHTQPSAPSHTLPLPKNKSGIRVTRIPAPLMSLSTAPPQTSNAVTAPPLAPIDIPVTAPPLALLDIPVTAPFDFGIHNEPTDAPALTLAQAAEIDRPAQADRVAPSTSAQVASTHDVEILDFSDIIPDLPKNVFTEFYDIFPVVQPNRTNCTVEELNKNKTKISKEKMGAIWTH